MNFKILDHNYKTSAIVIITHNWIIFFKIQVIFIYANYWFIITGFQLSFVLTNYGIIITGENSILRERLRFHIFTPCQNDPYGKVINYQEKKYVELSQEKNITDKETSEKSTKIHPVCIAYSIVS